MCILFHKWNKWEVYNQPMVIIPGIMSKEKEPIEYSEQRMRRTCKKCGYIQNEKLIKDT